MWHQEMHGNAQRCAGVSETNGLDLSVGEGPPAVALVLRGPSGALLAALPSASPQVE